MQHAYGAIYAKARQPLRDAMDLAYLTGQRRSDILKVTEQDIKEGCLLAQQNKTKTRLWIAITGDLEKTLDRILKRKAEHNTGHVDLVVNELGERVAFKTLMIFVRARTVAGLCAAEYQFRDLKAKVGTDKAELLGDIRRAQKQLGHTSIKITVACLTHSKHLTSQPDTHFLSFYCPLRHLAPTRWLYHFFCRAS